jgi:DNA-directed RNA polymerase specialized sigma subunit
VELFRKIRDFRYGCKAVARTLPDASELLDEQMRNEAIREVLTKTCNQHMRRVLELWQENVSYPEIAHELGITPRSARRLRDKAIREIRAVLKARGWLTA